MTIRSITLSLALIIFSNLSLFASNEKEDIVNTVKHFHDELTRYKTSYNADRVLYYFADHGKINISRTDMDTIQSDLHEIDYYLHRMDNFHSIFANQKDLHVYSIRTKKSEKEVVTVVNYFTKFSMKLESGDMYRGEHYCTALLKREGTHWKIFRLFVIDVEQAEERKECTAEFFFDEENPEEIVTKVVIPYDHGNEETLTDVQVTVYEGQRWVMVNEFAFTWDKDDRLKELDLDGHIIKDFGYVHTEEGAAFSILKDEVFKDKCVSMHLKNTHYAEADVEDHDIFEDEIIDNISEEEIFEADYEEPTEGIGIDEELDGKLH